MKTVFVTGADRGLGFALVNLLLESGHFVFAGHFKDINPELNALTQQFPEHLKLIALDLSQDASVKDACQKIKNQTKQLDMLINNAGILGEINTTIIDAIDFQDVLNTINVNALGPIRVIHELIEPILESDTKLVVNISSEAGSIGDNLRDGWYGYCMSKAALNMGGSLVHQKIKSVGGRVIQIHPGYIKSYMHGYLNTHGTYEPKEAAAHILKTIEGQLEGAVDEKPVFIDLFGNEMAW